MKKFRKTLILAITFLFVFGSLSLTAESQTKPLTFPEIITALNSKLPNSVFKTKTQVVNWLSGEIQKRKVEKSLSPEMEETLRQIGATSKFINQIRANSPTSPASGNLKTFKNSIGMEFVLIPAGSFFMGSDPTGSDADREDEFPRHFVTITKSFYIGKFEVTQENWESVMGNNPSHFKSCPKCPVEQVSWNEVQNFISRLNAKGEGKYRLPTEAEWEYSAKAGTTTIFAFGNILNTSQANFVSENDETNRAKSVPVGSFQPNNWGLFDMHGNVNEWVQDWEAPYSSLAQTDPKGPPTGTKRISRGGGWEVSAECLTSTIRYSDDPSQGDKHTGVRLVREE